MPADEVILPIRSLLVPPTRSFGFGILKQVFARPKCLGIPTAYGPCITTRVPLSPRHRIGRLKVRHALWMCSRSWSSAPRMAVRASSPADMLFPINSLIISSPWRSVGSQQRPVHRNAVWAFWHSILYVGGMWLHCEWRFRRLALRVGLATKATPSVVQGT